MTLMPVLTDDLRRGDLLLDREPEWDSEGEPHYKVTARHEIISVRRDEKRRRMVLRVSGDRSRPVTLSMNTDVWIERRVHSS